MSRQVITYAIDTTSGRVYSRVGSAIAVPVLQYGDMGPGNGYTPVYCLERFPVSAIQGSEWAALKWTRQVPDTVKNVHRAFWGMRPLGRRGCLNCGSTCGVAGCAVCDLRVRWCHVCDAAPTGALRFTVPVAEHS